LSRLSRFGGGEGQQLAKEELALGSGLTSMIIAARGWCLL